MPGASPVTLTLHGETRGSGPDLVLLHGWGTHGGVWGNFARRLAASHSVHVLDLPGHGLGAWQPGVTPEGLVSALSRQTPAGAVWLGWSLGGTLAALLAAAQPERVRGLVLLACNPCFVRRSDWPWGMDPEVFEAFAAGIAADPGAGLRRFAGLLCQGLDDPRPALKTLRERLDARPAPDPRALAQGLEWLRRLDVRPALARLTCPVLLLGGERDALVPRSALEARTAANPAIRAGQIAGASHVPFLSHEEDTLAELHPFLDRWARHA
jgi:pimeloyl-[acyl-carrier protein] methyl ester esterase